MSTDFNPLLDVKRKAAELSEREALLKRLVSGITPSRHVESTKRGSWEYRFSKDLAKWTIYPSRKEYRKLDLWDFVQLDNGLYAVVVDKGTESPNGILSLFTDAICYLVIGFADEVILK